MSADQESQIEVVKPKMAKPKPKAEAIQRENVCVLIEDGVELLYSFNEDSDKVLTDLARVLNGQTVEKKYGRARYHTFGKYWQVEGITIYPYAKSKGADQAAMYELFHTLAKLSV
jgi:hypothetical protein